MFGAQPGGVSELHTELSVYTVIMSLCRFINDIKVMYF
jgi:hypothetical protein